MHQSLHCVHNIRKITSACYFMLPSITPPTLTHHDSIVHMLAARPFVLQSIELYIMQPMHNQYN